MEKNNIPKFKPTVTRFNWYNDQEKYDDWYKQSDKFQDFHDAKQYNWDEYDDLKPTQMSDVDRLTKQQFDLSRRRFQPAFDEQNTQMYNELGSRGIGLGSTLSSDLMRDVNRNQGDILMGLEQNAYDKALNWGNMTFGQQLENRKSQMAEDLMKSNYDLAMDELLRNIGVDKATYNLAYDDQGINLSNLQAQYGLDFDKMMGDEMARRNELRLNRDRALNNLNLQNYQFDTNLAEQSRQFDVTSSQTQQQIDNQNQQFLERLGFDREQAAELSRQFDTNLAEQGRQFDVTSGQTQQQIDNQNQQFLERLGFDREQAAELSRQFDTNLAEQGRQFDVTSGQTQQQIDNQNQQFLERLGFDKEQAAELSRQFDTNLAEQSRQFDTNLAEQGRQFDITSGQTQQQIDNQGRVIDQTIKEFESKFGLDAALALADLIARGGHIDPNLWPDYIPANVDPEEVLPDTYNIPETVNVVDPEPTQTVTQTQPKRKWVQTGRGGYWTYE